MNTKPLLVLAPHQDDEVLGLGVHLAQWAKTTPIFVYFTSNGAPDQTIHPDRYPKLDCLTDSAYAARRFAEARTVLAALSDNAVARVNPFPSQSLVDRVENLTDSLAQLISELQPHTVIVPALEGAHPDHDATAVAAQLAISGASFPVSSMEYPIYTLASSVTKFNEPYNGGIAFVHALNSEEATQKRNLMKLYATQRGDAFLASFLQAMSQEVLQPLRFDAIKRLREQKNNPPYYSLNKNIRSSVDYVHDKLLRALHAR